MSANIRSMITSAKGWGRAATLDTKRRKFKAWPNGHVRVDGVHRTIAQAEADLYEARQEDKYGKEWALCPDKQCAECQAARSGVL